MTMLVEQDVFAVDQPIDALFKKLVESLERSSWRVIYTDFLCADERQEVRLVYGLSAPFTGSGLRSLMNEGARYIPFFVKITQLNEIESEVVVIVSGAGRLNGDDYGRNRKVIRKILKLCQG
jgi:hypothetical protein